MPIFVPGKRDRHNRPLRGGKRSVVAMLSLTAMVDMFTVLVVFLLQNYNSTGEAIDLDDKVVLPKASAVKELRPAHVVVVTSENIALDKVNVAKFEEVKAQQDWMIEALRVQLVEKFKKAAAEKEALAVKLRDAVQEANQEASGSKPEDDRRVTVQADKSVDFLTIKKVMFTLTEAGASEINFAVMKNPETAKAE